jgi:hypothetical protein
MMKQLTIGQVARQPGVKVETVKFYERRSLIEQPPRLGLPDVSPTDGSAHPLHPPRPAQRVSANL